MALSAAGDARDVHRPRMTMRRMIWAVGAVMTVLVLASVVPVAMGSRDLLTSAAALQQRQAMRTALDSAQAQIEMGETTMIAVTARDPAATNTDMLVQAQQQAQAGFVALTEFEQSATAAHAQLAGLAQLNTDVTGLHRKPGASAPLSAQARAAALQQFEVDATAVRNADDAWWARQLTQAHATAARTSWGLIGGTAAALLIGLIVIGLVARAAGGRDKTLREREEDLRRAAAANELEARLHRALEMAASEPQVYDVVEQAFTESLPKLHTELLLADSSRAHFARLLSTGPETEHHCGVESPADCPAAQRGQILSFASSAALDSCGYLRRASPEPRSATCLPVSIGGMTYGVVHAAGPAGELPGPDGRSTLELIARRASDRIGMLRAFDRSQLQAGTDPLTGLPNRRSLEAKVYELAARNVPYAVAFADLDHFKRLNDTHGHGAGDRALRVFAQVLREQVRPDDLVSRYGGEEFVIVLPNCPTDQAMRVLDRIREHLAIAIMNAGMPPFTVSFGLVETAGQGEFHERVAAADAALLAAKVGGRDRVVVAGPAGRTSVPA